jgi:hypothetical protein
MATLRITVVAEYEVDPAMYGVETPEQAAAEEREALENDWLGTLAFVGGDDIKTTVEVV